MVEIREHAVRFKQRAKSYGLALCCILCPFFFTAVLLEQSTKKLIPAQIEKIELQYKPAKPVAFRQPATSSSAASVQKPDPDPALYLQSQYVAGLYEFAIMNSIIYVFLAMTSALTSSIIAQRFGILVFVGVLFIEALVAYFFADPKWTSSAVDRALPLLINLYAAIDKFGALKLDHRNNYKAIDSVPISITSYRTLILMARLN